jgi:myo-inositol-1(or 4)-monophosphatase
LPATELNYAAERDALADALRDAGAIALKSFRNNVRHWVKDHDSPVCEADIAVDEMLRARLVRPGFGWLSEETKDDPARLDARFVFIVDPIDGTRAYLAGQSDWTIAAALVDSGRPVAAAVYAPVTDEMFTAAAGLGAFVNGMPMAVTDGGALQDAKVAGPKGYLDRLAKLAPQIAPVPKIFSLALRLTRVAQGSIDAAFASVHAHDWDLAAADLLVHEARGVMTTVAGARLIYNRPDPVHPSLLAAGRERHRVMLEVVRQRQKEFA